MKDIIKFIKLNKLAKLPVYANPGDAGMDLFCLEDYSLQPGERHAFNLGLAAEIPAGHYIRLSPKSGLALKYGIDVLAGVVDETYRGEWVVILINLGQEIKEFKVGDKIAQAVLTPYNQADFAVVDGLSETQRGGGGFGSSGR